MSQENVEASSAPRRPFERGTRCGARACLSSDPEIACDAARGPRLQGESTGSRARDYYARGLSCRDEWN